MKYYAAVDKDGIGKFLYYAKPLRLVDYWSPRKSIMNAGELKGFPNITWDDEPVAIKLTIEIDKD